MRADHPSNTKRGQVCLYYEEHFPIIQRDDIAKLKERLVMKTIMKNEQCFLTCLYIFLIGIHSMQTQKATTRHGATKQRSTKRLKHKEISLERIYS